MLLKCGKQVRSPAVNLMGGSVMSDNNTIALIVGAVCLTVVICTVIITIAVS